jgi:ribosome biogenesis GTPase
LNKNNIGFVVSAFGKDSLIEIDGKQINTTARQNNKCVVGDFVEFNGEVITKILPRKNLLANNGKNIASNIDKIFLTLAIEPHPQLESIDNYLIKAKASNIDIEIIINKSDIEDKKNIEKLAKIYTDIGYSMSFISAEKNQNTDVLFEKTKNKVCVFVGQSGVGKSSIVNFLTNNSQKINQLGKDGLGKHTTTSSKVFTLKNSCKIIDTPGVREFIPTDFTKDEIKRGFIEFNDFADKCKFNNCNHINEPKCEVKNQLELGNISQYRYNNYCQLFVSL